MGHLLYYQSANCLLQPVCSCGSLAPAAPPSQPRGHSQTRGSARAAQAQLPSCPDLHNNCAILTIYVDTLIHVGLRV